MERIIPHPGLNLRSKPLWAVVTVLTVAAVTLVLAAVRSSGFTLELAQRDIYLSLAALAVSTIFFCLELLPLSVTAMCLPVYLTLTGVLTEQEAFAAFSNDTILMFAGMFVVGGALFFTGVAHTFGRLVVRLAGGSQTRLILGIIAVTAILSSVLSNTGSVAVLMPICLGIADSAGMRKKDLLMPLTITASTGGMITMVGTPPNATVHSVLIQSGLDGFSFLEFAWVGIPLTLFAGLFLILPLSRRLLSPDRTQCEIVSPADATASVPREAVWKQVLSVLLLLGVVAVMALGTMPLGVAAMSGAVLCVLTGIVPPGRAVNSIDWTTIFLFVGTLSLANALEVSGAGKLIADLVLTLAGSQASEFALLTILFFACGLMTQFMSNTACCALLASIGLKIATGLNASPRGVMMVIAIASSSAFMTPIGTPPNTLVFGPGGFRFRDYVCVGAPVFLCSYLVCILVVPLVWPLF